MKYLSYVVAGLIAFFALMPPIAFHVNNPSILVWTGIVSFAGFLGLLLSFTKVNVFIKIIAIGGFIHCFLTTVPFISLTAYLSMLACCYFYLLCSKVRDWTPVFNTVLAILIFECIFVLIQVLKKDTLFNFGYGGGCCWGTIGNQMQLESFLVIVSAFLIQRANWRVVALIIVSGLLYTALYGGVKLHLYTSYLERLEAWIPTLQITQQHPLIGWGLGSFKFVFPALTHIPYDRVHNDWMQIAFETGYIGLALVLTICTTLLTKLFKEKNILALIAMALISLDMCVHFPLRMIQCPLIIIAFIAYCNRKTTFFEGEVYANTTKSTGHSQFSLGTSETTQDSLDGGSLSTSTSG